MRGRETGVVVSGHALGPSKLSSSSMAILEADSRSTSMESLMVVSIAVAITDEYAIDEVLGSVGRRKLKTGGWWTDWTKLPNVTQAVPHLDTLQWQICDSSL
jgi:hypothetical protein